MYSMIKNYTEWLGESLQPSMFLTPSQIAWCESHVEGQWSVNEKGEVTVPGDLRIDASPAASYFSTDQSFPVQFADLGGNFSCSLKNLKSLKGSPRRVEGNFSCVGCESLLDLEGAPSHVGGDFDCRNCHKLKTLEGAPSHVGGAFKATQSLSLESLGNTLSEVEGDFVVYNCRNLTSIMSSLKRVGGNLDCRSCSIETLQGAPVTAGKILCDSSLPEAETDLMENNPDLFDRWVRSKVTLEEFMDPKGPWRGAVASSRFKV